MSPHLQNYGTDDDLYVVIEDLQPGISLEVTEDGDQFWVSVKSAEGTLLGDAAINPRSRQTSTYDKHRYSTADYPVPRDDGDTALGVDIGPDPPTGLSPRVNLGQYLTRVDSLTAADLAGGEAPEQFATVDDAQSFIGMYVLELPPAPEVSDEPPDDEDEHAVGTDREPTPDALRAEADTSVLAPGPVGSTEEQPDMDVTLFDLETEREFDMSVTDFTAHYGVTVWNTGRLWHE